MTLRLRLVAAIVLLATAGLVLFAVVTYSLYSNSEYQGLDRQLLSSVGVIGNALAPAGPGVLPGGGARPGVGAGGGASGTGQPPPIVVPYGALYTSSGKLVAALPVESKTAGSPRLPKGALSGANVNRLLTTGSVSGGTTWRVLITTFRGTGDYLVLASPTTSVTTALHDLVLIETSAAAGLLVLLSLGAAVILGRGLRPLEQIAATARLISGGDLSQRVRVASDQGEIGQLGNAFNAMLEDIAAAFATRDMTEERLRQFLADASHELRTPLTSIKGYAELARLGQGTTSPEATTGGSSPEKGSLDAASSAAAGHGLAAPNASLPDPQPGEAAGHGRTDAVAVDPLTALDRIEDQAGRMSLLVEDLLLLARLDERRHARRAPVDLTVVTADACSEAVAVAPGRHVTFQGPQPVVVLGDESHLRQAISNIVSNAVRHTEASVAIEVRCVEDEGRALVSVRDHGRGLTDEELGHLFDRFWRGDKARTAKGSGLGLSIVQAIAAEHGGRAEATNCDDGGALVTLVLPVGQDPAKSAGVPSDL
ncbi:MAG: sensor histidine kinase [Acidimicrobiales bacterium]